MRMAADTASDRSISGDVREVFILVDPWNVGADGIFIESQSRATSSIVGENSNSSKALARLNYGHLVVEYVRLNRSNERFAQIPHGRYINFVSDFLAAEKGATREDAMKAWERLKRLDVPKDYRSWVKSQSKSR
jgi:hypothetical protein